MTTAAVDVPEADAPQHTGGMVALIPADEYVDKLTVEGGDPSEQLHLTLAYLGDDVTGWPAENASKLIEQMRSLADTADGPVMARVFGRALLNPDGGPDGDFDPCAVYLVGDSPSLRMLQDMVVGNVSGKDGVPPQHPLFLPHVTAGYGLDPDALTYTGPVVFDRLRVALADDYTDIPLGGDSVTAAAPIADPGLQPATGTPAEIVEDTGDTIKVHWPVLAVEGFDTGDGRYLEPGGVSHRQLPLPLMALPYKAHGGQEPPPAEVFGRVTELTRRPGPEVTSKGTGKPFPEGTFIWSGNAEVDGAHKFADLVRKGYLRGGSVDAGDFDAELIDEETAAMSDHPRRRAVVSLYEIAGATMVPVPAFADSYCDLVDDQDAPEAVAASAMPADMRTDPVPMWRSFNLDPTTEITAMAASGTYTPPIAWFRDPGLDGPTPLTVTDDGRVYGHLATWGSNHISYPGRRVTPPRSRSDYSFFHVGSVRVLDNNEPVTISAGHIALDTGHADLNADYRTATAHYDNTGAIVADVCAGEDTHGIWVAGALVPGVDDLKLHKLRSCGLSGDWRRIGAGLELVAALSVPTPGFPVPRARIASGEPRAMVAAGALAPTGRPVDVLSGLDVDSFAEAVAERLAARQKRDAELAAQREALLAELDDNPARMAELLAQLDEAEGRAELEELGLTAEQIAAFDISRMPPQLQKSYIGGKAAAKIGWGKDGDFDRCVAEARHHGIPAHMRKGMCATLHKKATGQVPGKH